MNTILYIWPCEYNMQKWILGTVLDLCFHFSPCNIEVGSILEWQRGFFKYRTNTSSFKYISHFQWLLVKRRRKMRRSRRIQNRRKERKGERRSNYFRTWTWCSWNQGMELVCIQRRSKRERRRNKEREKEEEKRIGWRKNYLRTWMCDLGVNGRSQCIFWRRKKTGEARREGKSWSYHLMRLSYTRISLFSLSQLL